MKYQSNFVIVGAGPKALAVTAKAYVLNKLFDISMPKFHVIERKEVGANWTGSNGFTNGKLRLGTSPQKDIGFPYNFQLFDAEENMLVNEEMRKFSWDMYLIKKGAYGEWVDRGRPNPTHNDWAEYLKYNFDQLRDFVQIHKGELKEVSYHLDHFNISYVTSEGEVSIESENLMFTGPGKPKKTLSSKAERVLDIHSYWKRKSSFKKNEKVLIIGGGENSATIAIDILNRFDEENLTLDIMTPNGALLSRGESYYENRVYTDAEKGNWKELSSSERIAFIKHTDMGVYSVDAMEKLNSFGNLNVLKGSVKTSTELNNKVSVVINNKSKVMTYDRVIWANGFERVGVFRDVLDLDSLKEIEKKVGVINDRNLEERVEADFSLGGITPNVFLPMVSGFKYGPGFSNLSSLGTLSDRILSKIVSKSTKRGIYELSS